MGHSIQEIVSEFFSPDNLPFLIRDSLNKTTGRMSDIPQHDNRGTKCNREENSYYLKLSQAVADACNP